MMKEVLVSKLYSEKNQSNFLCNNNTYIQHIFNTSNRAHLFIAKNNKYILPYNLTISEKHTTYFDYYKIEYFETENIINLLL